MKNFRLLFAILLSFASLAVPQGGGKKLRIICFGAHPDDAEIRTGGVAALWAARGDAVKFVCMTNGDAGHWREAGEPLAKRRKAEVEGAAAILGNTVEVLGSHDGELMPTLENRKTVVRLIREWKADIVMTHRPNDYHPDHRYTAVLVQDAAYMVAVPNYCPETPALGWNPLFLYYLDRFEKPNPFSPDIVVPIDRVIQKKLDAVLGMESQFVEGGVSGSEELMPSEPAKQRERRNQVRSDFDNRFHDPAVRYRKQLGEWIGMDLAKNVKYAEAFEICEYGRRPDKAEIKNLFPFFDQ